MGLREDAAAWKWYLMTHGDAFGTMPESEVEELLNIGRDAYKAGDMETYEYWKWRIEEGAKEARYIQSIAKLRHGPVKP